MNIWVFTIVRNRAEQVPFFLRHYAKLASRIYVWDDQSTDGTRELFQACPIVRLFNWPHSDGMDEYQFLAHAYKTYPMACGQANWAAWVDADEILYHPDFMGVLKEAWNKQYEVIRTEGFNMVADGFPKDDGHSQIWELCKTGLPASVYGKPVVFRPCAHVRWSRGKHTIEREHPGTKEKCNPVMSPGPMLKLLHYRYMGEAYTAQRNAQNYERTGLRNGDKRCAWTCAPNYTGEHSAQWAGQVAHKGTNVVDSPIV